MRKVLVIVFSLAFLAFVGFGWLIELEPETWETYELRGRVSRLTISYEFFDDDAWFDDWNDDWDMWDDDDDWDMWDDDDWDDWALPGKIVIHFNEFGQSTYEAYYDADGYLIEEYEYYFDDEGRLVGLSMDEEFGITELVINEFGKIERITFDIPGEGKFFVSMAYDERGNLVEQVMSGGEGEDYFEMSMTASYDYADRMIDQSTYFFGELWIKEVFEYDDLGQKIAIHEYMYLWDDDPEPMTTHFEYNEWGDVVRQVEEMLYYPEPDVTEFHYEYDSEGNILTMVVIDSWGDVSAYVYDRDAHGNYTKKTTYFLYDPEMLEEPGWLDYAEVYEIEHREIEYF